MSKTGFPSLTALLGLLAVAGYQNRDKLAGWLGPQERSGAGGSMTGHPGGGHAGGGYSGGGQFGSEAGAPAGLDRILGGLGGLGGAGAAGGIGGMLSSGIGELVERFRNAGRGETAESWVRTGPNAPVEPEDLEHTLGPDTLDDLAARTGLSRAELVQRLSRELPSAIDRYTPEGRL